MKFGSARHILLFALLTLCLCAQATPSYRGLMRLPASLYTADGVLLEPGEYAIEVRNEKGRYTLEFLSGRRLKAHVDGELSSDDSISLSTYIPLVGTHYMRSSAEPIATAQERQFSKTGQAQYEEEKRDWKAAMRVYKSPEDQQALFIYQERVGRGNWRTVKFQMSLKKR